MGSLAIVDAIWVPLQKQKAWKRGCRILMGVPIARIRNGSLRGEIKADARLWIAFPRQPGLEKPWAEMFLPFPASQNATNREALLRV
jgi:hypothetical protein